MLPFFHRHVTKDALASAGATPKVQGIVGETSRWPDWYCWRVRTPHAQTPSDSQGRPVRPDNAARDSSALLAQHLQRVASLTPTSYVWLGFAFHLVQDLAAHLGRTNEEHAFDILLPWLNPDYAPASIRRGRAYSAQLIQALQTRIGSEQLSALLTNPGARLADSAERSNLLGQRDFRWREIGSLMPSAFRYYRLPDTHKRVRWNPDQVLADAFSQLSSQLE